MSALTKNADALAEPQQQTDSPFKTPVIESKYTSTAIVDGNNEVCASVMPKQRPYIVAAINSYAANAKRDEVMKQMAEALRLATTALDVNDPNHETQITNYCSINSSIREAHAALSAYEELQK